MPIIATNKGDGDFKLIPEGSYQAICISIIHIGHVTEEYQGKQKLANKVMFLFETPTETEIFDEEKGAEPFTIWSEYTLSLHEKSNLRGHLEGWRGKPFTEQEAEGFDVEKVLGQQCTVAVKHKTAKTSGKVRQEIWMITPRQGEQLHKVNPLMSFSYDPFDQSKFAQLPEWIQNKIKLAQEYQDLHTGAPATPPAQIPNPNATSSTNQPAMAAPVGEAEADDLPF